MVRLRSSGVHPFESHPPRLCHASWTKHVVTIWTVPKEEIPTNYPLFEQNMSSFCGQVHCLPGFCARKKRHGPQAAVAPPALQGCGFLVLGSFLVVEVFLSSDLVFALWLQALLSALHLLVIMAFLANLGEKDEWKWMICFAVPWPSALGKPPIGLNDIK